MALSFQLTSAGFPPDELKTEGLVKLEPGEAGFSITSITLKLEGKVPNITEEKFIELANAAKAGCPVSRALGAVEILLEAKLV